MSTGNVRITQNIEDALIRNQIWEIYRKSFEGQELKCAQNQKCYTEETFRMTLTDPEYYKYYILSTEGSVVAYMLSTNNLQKASITYFNPERYAKLFPEFSPDKIYYCTSLATVPGQRSSRFFYQLMSVYLRHILVELKSMHAFDFSHETIPNLPEVLMKMGKRLVKEGVLKYEFEYVKIGAQEFGALAPIKKPAE